jgi:hypothetical protein
MAHRTTDLILRITGLPGPFWIAFVMSHGDELVGWAGRNRSDCPDLAHF